MSIKLRSLFLSCLAALLLSLSATPAISQDLADLIDLHGAYLRDVPRFDVQSIGMMGARIYIRAGEKGEDPTVAECIRVAPASANECSPREEAGSDGIEIPIWSKSGLTDAPIHSCEVQRIVIREGYCGFCRVRNKKCET